jgi:hypothetical protein
MEVLMKRFKLFAVNWWILHLLAIAFFFFLGHAMHFVKG